MVDMESRSTSVWTHQIVELKHTQLARARQTTTAGGLDGSTIDSWHVSGKSSCNGLCVASNLLREGSFLCEALSCEYNISSKYYVRDMASEKHIGTVYNTLFYVILLYFLHILHSLHNH